MDHRKPTVQMLGRYQPWHDGHTELFKKAHRKTGQVAIMVRLLPQSDKDPFTFHEVSTRIMQALGNKFEHGKDYEIMQVPNIVDISYGRDVGYTLTKHDLGEKIHNISATRIRKEINSIKENL